MRRTPNKGNYVKQNDDPLASPDYGTAITEAERIALAMMRKPKPYVKPRKKPKLATFSWDKDK